MQKKRSLQMIEILPSMFNFVRVSHGFVDEAAYRFGDRATHTAALLYFGVPIKLGVADGNKMLPAKFLPVKRRNYSKVTASKTTAFSSRHISSTR
jgi:hypothetical protein